MNWIALFAAMAVAAIIFSLGADLELTKCHTGSMYSMLHFCKPDNPPRTPSKFDCRFHPDGC
jgi:hypothetical protein